MPSNSLRRAALALAVLCALSACDRGASTDPAATTAPAAAPAPAATTSGIDLAGIDKTVQPGDDSPGAFGVSEPALGLSWSLLHGVSFR